MCVLSGVYDHYKPLFQPLGPFTPPQTFPFMPSLPIQPMIITPPISPAEVAELRQLIKDFKEAVKAAKTVDRLTNQPDCSDPEKAKLLKRVATLEKELAKLKKQA